MTDLIEDCLNIVEGNDIDDRKSRDWVNRTERRTTIGIEFWKLYKQNSICLQTGYQKELIVFERYFDVKRLCRSVEAADLLKDGMRCTSIIAYELCKEDRARTNPRCVNVTIPGNKQIY